MVGDVLLDAATSFAEKLRGHLSRREHAYPERPSISVRRRGSGLRALAPAAIPMRHRTVRLVSALPARRMPPTHPAGA